jgi:hypothetical protein
MKRLIQLLVGLSVVLGIVFHILRNDVQGTVSDEIDSSSLSSCASSAPEGLPSWDDIPFFEAPFRAPICAKVPNASASFLWNVHAHAHANVVWTTQDLRRGMRSRPRHTDWGRVLDKIHGKLIRQDDKTAQPSSPVQILVLSGNSELGRDSCKASDTIACQPAWPALLEEWVNRYLGKGGVVSIQTLAINGTTSTFAESLQRFQLLPMRDIDIIIDAYASQEMMRLDGVDDVSSTPDFGNQLRQQKQAWIRSVLLECHKDDDPLPLLFMLDDHVGGNGLLTDHTYTRVVQRLADWCQLPMVSWGAMVRPQLYATNAANNNNANRQAILGTARGIASLLAFAMMDFTIDYCNSNDNPGSSHLLRPAVQELVDRVVPPALDLDLTLNQVSSKWKAAAEEQGNCTKFTTTCPVAYVDAFGDTTRKSLLFNTSQHGWIYQAKIQLSAQTRTWKTSFRLERPGTFQIFFGHDVIGSNPSSLEIRLEPSTTSEGEATWRTLSTTLQDRNPLLPHTIDLSSWNEEKSTQGTLTLKLLGQDSTSIRIAGLFVCNAPN